MAAPEPPCSSMTSNWQPSSPTPGRAHVVEHRAKERRARQSSPSRKCTNSASSGRRWQPKVRPAMGFVGSFVSSKRRAARDQLAQAIDGAVGAPLSTTTQYQPAWFGPKSTRSWRPRGGRCCGDDDAVSMRVLRREDQSGRSDRPHIPHMARACSQPVMSYTLAASLIACVGGRRSEPWQRSPTRRSALRAEARRLHPDHRVQRHAAMRRIGGDTETCEQVRG